MPSIPPAPPSIPPAPPSSRRSLWVAIVICLLVAGAAMLVLRSLDDPWTGTMGRLLFGKDAGKMPAGDRYLRVLQCCFDTGFPGREKLTVDDWVRIGLRVSSTLVAAAALLAALTAPLWTRWIRRTDGPASPAPRPRAAAWSIWVLVGALVLAASLRLPSVRCYVTYDEQDNARRNYHGYHEFAKPGAPAEWVEARWQDAVWENERGNNPFLFSFLSQSSQAVWRMAAGAPRERFDLVAMRLPSLLFGLAAVAAVWWSMNTLGLPRAAPWAAVLMATHALAMHHSIEARAYGLCLCFSALLLGLAWRVLHDGRGWEWALFGLLVCASILAYPGMLYYVASLNVFVALVLLWGGWKQGDRAARTGLARWFLANTAAAMAFLWVFFPAFPQAAGFFAQKFPEGNLSPDWVSGAFVAYSTGMITLFHKQVGEPGWSGPTELAWFFTQFLKMWPLALMAYVVFPVLVAWGWVSSWRGDGGKLRTALLTVCLLSGAAMFCHHAFLTGYSLYYWYVIFILPALLGIEANGLARAGEAVARWIRQPQCATPLGGVAALVVSGWLLWTSYSWENSSLWQDSMASLARQPPRGAGSGDPGEIPRTEIQRGRSLWVTYQDGFQLRFHDYEAHLSEWMAFKKRPVSQWGVLPGPAAKTP